MFANAAAAAAANDVEGAIQALELLIWAFNDRLSLTCHHHTRWQVLLLSLSLSVSELCVSFVARIESN